jgi:SAM-dependent methyltransferase
MEIDLHAPYLEKAEAEKLLNFAQKANFRGGYTDDFNTNFKAPKSGGMSYYLPYDDSRGVLYSNIFTHVKPTDFQKTMEEVYRVYKTGAKVAPVLGYARNQNGRGIPNPNWRGEDRDDIARDAIFVARAPGEQLINTTPDMRLLGPGTDYKELTRTFFEIMKSKISVDIHAQNIIYHPVAGFNFIDFAHLQNEPLVERIIPQTEKLLCTFAFSQNNLSLRDQNKKSTIAEQQHIVSGLLDIGLQKNHIEPGIKKASNLTGVTTIDELFLK